MKRSVLAMAATLLLCGASLAQQGPVEGTSAGCSNCEQNGAGGSAYGPELGGRRAFGGGGCNDSRYGLNPFFRRLMFWKKDTQCGTVGLRGRGFGGGYGPGAGEEAAFNPYPNGVPGTLVFPNNPYIRAPRDWYLSER